MIADGRDSRRLTLRAAFERYYRDDVAAASTMEGYESLLRKWERLIPDDPPVSEITKETLKSYRAACLELGNQPPTVNKDRRMLLALLRRLGPAGFRNPEGEGILERVPYVRALKEEREFPRVISLEELSRLYEVCAGAVWPRRGQVRPCWWWRCLLAIVFNCGARREDLLGLRIGDVDLEGAAVRFRARKTGKLQVVPLHSVAVAHLRLICGLCGPRVFGSLSSGKAFDREFHRLQALAGLDEFDLQTLRKTSGTAWASAGGNDVAEYVLGHVLGGVTARYYVNPAGRVVEVSRRLEQPAAFLSILGDWPGGDVLARGWCRQDWSFGVDSVSFRGQAVRLRPRLRRLLQVLVGAGQVDFAGVRSGVFWNSPAVARVTLKRTVEDLRVALERELGLPAGWNAVRWVREAGVWRLELP